MSRGRWGILLALGLVLAAAIGLGGAGYLIYSGITLEDSYQRETKAETRAYSQRAHEAIEGRCRRLPAPRQYECIAEEREAARKGQHDKRDLEAQQVTATWTRYMGIAAIAGTGFGILGIALVLATFWTNKQAAEEAKRSADAAHHANRPWLQFTELDVTELRYSRPRDGVPLGRLEAVVTTTVKNIGKTPAEGVQIDTIIFGAPASEESKEPLAAAKMKLRETLRKHSRRKYVFGRVIFPDETANFVLVPSIHDQRIPATLDLFDEDATFAVHILVGVSYFYERQIRFTIIPVRLYGHRDPDQHFLFDTGILEEGTHTKPSYTVLFSERTVDAS